MANIVVVTADKVIVKVTLALVMTLEVWPKEQVAQARRVYLSLEASKGHTSISKAPLHCEKSAATQNLLNY